MSYYHNHQYNIASFSTLIINLDLHYGDLEAHDVDDDDLEAHDAKDDNGSKD